MKTPRPPFDASHAAWVVWPPWVVGRGHVSISIISSGMGHTASTHMTRTQHSNAVQLCGARGVYASGLRAGTWSQVPAEASQVALVAVPGAKAAVGV